MTEVRPSGPASRRVAKVAIGQAQPFGVFVHDVCKASSVPAMHSARTTEGHCRQSHDAVEKFSTLTCSRGQEHGRRSRAMPFCKVSGPNVHIC